MNAQFGPHDLAGPARDALPAPSIAHRLDQDQTAAALVIRAGLLRDRSPRDDVPDLDQDAGVVGGQPHYHDRQPRPVILGTAIGACRCPDGVRDQLADDELGRFGQVVKSPLGQHGAGVHPGAGCRRHQCAERETTRRRPRCHPLRVRDSVQPDHHSALAHGPARPSFPPHAKRKAHAPWRLARGLLGGHLPTSGRRKSVRKRLGGQVHTPRRAGGLAKRSVQSG